MGKSGNGKIARPPPYARARIYDAVGGKWEKRGSVTEIYVVTPYSSAAGYKSLNDVRVMVGRGGGGFVAQQNFTQNTTQTPRKNII